MEDSGDPEKRRKLNRMELARRLEERQEEPAPIISNHRRVIEERNKDLK